MDIFSLPKETVLFVARFAQEQFLTWLRILENPLSVLSEVDLRSPDSLLSALRFALFVYIATWMVAIPDMVRYQKTNPLDLTTFLVDLVTTGLLFLWVGLTLFLSGRTLRGRGTLFANIIAGLYLTAIYPIIKVADYFTPLWRETRQMVPWAIGARLITMSVIVFGVATLFVRQAVPTLRHIHAFGPVRATMATLLCMGLIVTAYYFVLDPLFLEPVRQR